MHTSLVCFLTLASIASASPATPQSTPPTTVESSGAETSAEVQQLKNVVRDLQNQVDSLKAANDDQWLTEQRANEIRGLVQDVLADADTRASLLQSGAMAGYDKGFFISSADGNYMLRVFGQLQIRYVYNWRDDGADDSNRGGFEVRRAKVGFKGTVFDPSWSYELLLGAQTSGNVVVDDNAWIQKDFGNGFKVKLGQMKAPFTREEILSSTRLFAVERSLVNTFFTSGTVQGVNGIYEADRWRVAAMYNDGPKTNNTSFDLCSTC